MSSATRAYIFAQSIRSPISTNFSFSPGAVFRGKPKVAAGIPTSLKMLTSRHMLISGVETGGHSPPLIVRWAFRIDFTSGSTFFPSYARRAVYIFTSPPEHLAKQMGIAAPLFGKPAGQGRIGQLCTGGIP